MRKAYFIISFFLTGFHLQGQDLFVIYGEDFACLYYHYDYFVETSNPLINFEWTVLPETGTYILDQDGSEAFIQFLAPGSYLIIANGYGPNQEFYSDTLTVYVSNSNDNLLIEGCYELNDDTNCYQVCAYSTMTVYDQTGSNGNYVVDGADSYENHGGFVDITWGAPGRGFITNNVPCGAQICVEILPQPTADFNSSPSALMDTITLCKGQEIQFQNNSQNATTIEWSFGDGEFSSLPNPYHSYLEEGFYIVKLTAMGVCCENEKQVVVNVLPAATLKLDCINAVCPGTKQTYTVVSGDCNQYNWSVTPNGSIINGGDSGDDFIEVIWSSGPDGFIYVEVGDCITDYCQSIKSFRIPVISPDGPITGDQYVCSGDYATYNAPYFPGVIYTWELGPYGTFIGSTDESSVTVKWEGPVDPNASWIKVTYDNCFLECGGSATLSIGIAPTFRISGDPLLCQQSEGIFFTAGTATPPDVFWTIENESGEVVFSDPIPKASIHHTFNYPAGVYKWIAYNYSGSFCNEKDEYRFQIIATPSDEFTVEGEREICPGVQYGYTAFGDGNYAYIWEITDGASVHTFRGQTIQYTFSTTPPYQVKVVRADLLFDECQSPPVIIDLTTPEVFTIAGTDEACFNSIDTFSVPFVGGIDYTWSLIPPDAGEIRSLHNNMAEVFWTATGNVVLRVQACSQVVDKNILVHELPLFNLSAPLQACPGEAISVTTDQPAYTHRWRTESNGLISAAASANLLPATYSVEVTDQNGCVNSKPFTIASYPSPKVNLTSNANSFYCSTLPSGIEIVTNTDGDGYQFEWFKNNVSQGGGGPTYSVTEFGSYYVVVTNEYGCKTTSSVISIEDCCPPSDCGTGGGLPSSCAPIPYDFNLTISGIACEVKNYKPVVPDLDPGSGRWVILSASNGTIADITADELDFTYSLPGYYKVIFYGKIMSFPYTPASCTHTAFFIDKISAVADFSYSGYCTNAGIAFEDLTTFLPDETIATWHWDFDDPGSGASNISNLKDPDHIFTLPGVYDVRLTVTMASGCTSTKVLPVTISDGPVITPLFESIYCENEGQPFSVLENLFDIKWEFGDPASGTQNTASGNEVLHTFDAPALHTIMVSAGDHYGCINDISFDVDIKPNTLSGVITASPELVICFGDTVELTSPVGGIEWLWSHGEITETTDIDVSNQYSVLMTDANHCTYSPPPVFVEVIPAPDVIIKAREILGGGEFGPWTDSLVVCQGQEFELTAFGSTNVSYDWSTGQSGKTISFTIEGGNLPGAGKLIYYVITEHWTSGCFSDTAFIDVEVIANPNYPVINLTDGSGCGHDLNTLTVVNPQTGIQYIWSDGQKGLTITTEKSGDYYVVAFNANGCSTKGNTVTIKPAAPVDQIPGGCFIKCDPLEVCLPDITSMNYFSLYHNGNVILSGTSLPDDFTITQDGSYVFEISTDNGCVVQSDPLNITLYPGIGSVTVITYIDTDNDGTISAGDAVLPDIDVNIISDDGLYGGHSPTGDNGQFVFEDFPLSTYTATFDRDLLSSQWKIVIDSATTVIAACDDSVTVSLLVTPNCTVTGPDVYYDLCPGESITIGNEVFNETGTFELHLLSSQNCDSIVNVIIETPDSFYIETTVWMDLDGNHVVSASDTVVPGITILFDRMISISPDTGITDITGTTGNFFPAVPYLVSVDSTVLPENMQLIYGVALLPDTTCGMIHIDFLLGTACETVFIIEEEYLCKGDSLWIEDQWIYDEGVYSFTLSAPGVLCDTVLDVYVYQYPEFTVTTSTSWDCNDFGTIAVHASGIAPFTYSWPPLSVTDSVLIGVDAGIYNVIVTDVHGCSLNEIIELEETPLHNFYIQPIYEINEGDTILITILGDTDDPSNQYQWFETAILECDTCYETLVYPLSDTLLHISIVDSNNCVYELQTRIVLLEVDTLINDAIFAPNVFSPNGDGINDRFSLSGKLPGIYVYELAIYDRWGELVYYTQEKSLDTFDGWDGKFYKRDLNPQVFAWYARVRLADGVEKNLKGDLTLIR